MKKIKTAIALFIAALMVFATGCGGSKQTTTDQQNTQQAEQKKPSMITMSRDADSDNLDPVNQDGNVNIWMFNLAMEGLVKSSDDGKSIEPLLAEKWDISADKLTYTFHLRPGVKFSDGTPVKGEDWVWSLKRARDTKESAWAFSLEAVKDITSPDDNTVVVTLKQPWAAILADLAMFNATVTSKAYFEKVGAEGFSQKPIGTGPFMFTEWKKGEYILFDKNPNYWQAGLPKTDQIKVTVVPDDSTRIMQLQAGDVDIITFVPWNRMDELKGDPNLQAMDIPSTETRYLQFNTTKKVFSDVRVRQALDMATDKEAMKKTVLYGHGEAATAFMSVAGMYWNDQIKGRTYDVEGAKKLLAEAGYPNGFDATITIASGNTVAQSIATIIKEQWAKVGVRINIEVLEAATVTENFKAMKTDMTIRGWTNDMVDPSQQVDYACVYANIKNFYTGWDNKEVEKLAVQGKSELDDAKRKEAYFKIQELYFNEVPMIPLYYVPYPVVMKKSVKGFVQTPLGNYRFENLEKAEK